MLSYLVNCFILITRKFTKQTKIRKYAHGAFQAKIRELYKTPDLLIRVGLGQGPLE
jgi:hypothetical protein